MLNESQATAGPADAGASDLAAQVQQAQKVVPVGERQFRITLQKGGHVIIRRIALSRLQAIRQACGFSPDNFMSLTKARDYVVRAAIVAGDVPVHPETGQPCSVKPVPDNVAGTAVAVDVLDCIDCESDFAVIQAIAQHGLSPEHAKN
ncbi:MAG: hypothetical protein AMXMBFR58_29640 [Phycisphaerae bacterium]